MEIKGHWYCRGTGEVGRIFESVVDMLLAKHVALLNGEKIPEIPDVVLGQSKHWTESVVIRLPNNYGAALDDEKVIVLKITLYGVSHDGVRVLSFIEMNRGFAAKFDTELTSSDKWDFEISTVHDPNGTKYSVALIGGQSDILGHAQTETMAQALFTNFVDDLPFISQVACDVRLKRIEKLFADQHEKLFKGVKK